MGRVSRRVDLNPNTFFLYLLLPVLYGSHSLWVDLNPYKLFRIFRVLAMSIVSCHQWVNPNPSNPCTINRSTVLRGWAWTDPWFNWVKQVWPDYNPNNLYRTLTRFIHVVSVSSWQVVLEIVTLRRNEKHYLVPFYSSITS